MGFSHSPKYNNIIKIYQFFLFQKLLVFQQFTFFHVVFGKTSEEQQSGEPTRRIKTTPTDQAAQSMAYSECASQGSGWSPYSIILDSRYF